MEIIDLIQKYDGLIAMAFTGLMILLSSKFVTREQQAAQIGEINGRVAAVAEKVELLEDRTSKIEGEIEHLPDKDITHRLELSLVEMKGELTAMNEKLRPVAATMTRMQDLLMERPGR